MNKRFRPSLLSMIHMTLNCYTNVHSLVTYRPFTAMLVLSVFFSILPKCLFVIIVMYAYFHKPSS